MGARKAKKGKAGKKTQPSKKMPLWLRDLLNIVGGLLVGIVGFWLVQGYLEGRVARKASDKYLQGVQESAELIKPFAEKYLSVTEKKQKDSSPLEGLDLSGPVGSLETFRNVQKDFPALSPRTVAHLWEFSRNLYEAEILRKLIKEQKENPDQISILLSREFLRSLYEDSRLAPKLLWELKNPGSEE